MCLCPRRSGKRSPRQTQQGPGSRPSVATALPGRLGTYPCEPNVTRLAHRDSIHPTSLAHHVRDALLPQQGPGCRPPRRLLIFPVPWRTRLPGHCPPSPVGRPPGCSASCLGLAFDPSPRWHGCAPHPRRALPTPLGSPTPGCPPPLPGRWLEDAVDAKARRRREGGAGRRPPRRLLCFCFTLKRRAKCALRSRTGAFPLPL